MIPKYIVLLILLFLSFLLALKIIPKEKDSCSKIAELYEISKKTGKEFIIEVNLEKRCIVGNVIIPKGKYIIKINSTNIVYIKK